MRWLAILGLATVLVAPVQAQERPAPERLREQVMRRFMENYRNQAGLTDEQFARFQDVTRRAWERRRELEQRERALLRALEGQMRPGVAADQDSVAALIDALIDAQAARVQHARSDQEEYAAFLNPVQRAQIVLAWTRLERQIQQIVRRRMENRMNQ